MDCVIDVEIIAADAGVFPKHIVGERQRRTAVPVGNVLGREVHGELSAVHPVSIHDRSAHHLIRSDDDRGHPRRVVPGHRQPG